MKPEEIIKRIRKACDTIYEKYEGNPLIEKDDILTPFEDIITDYYEEVKEVDLEMEQRMKECPYRRVGCAMYEGKILECRGACGWVVDHLNLKKLKAQKGEEV